VTLNFAIVVLTFATPYTVDGGEMGGGGMLTDFKGPAPTLFPPNIECDAPT
jgi:hypothetical protein